MSRIVALLSIVLVAPWAVAQAPFSGMKYRIPSNANAMILINAQKLFDSPIADKERWAQRAQAAYDAGLSALAPDATEVILAGRFDIEYGKSIYELSLVRHTADRDITYVAQRYGGTMDNLEGRSACRLPNDMFVVELNDTLAATYTPANRQEASRWLRSNDKISTSKKLSPYMEKAFDYATKVGTPIIMALDVEGTFSEAYVRQQLETHPFLKEAGVDLDKLAKQISGVNGVTLGVTVGTNTVGAIRVDFEDAAGDLAQVGKPLLLEILGRSGAMVDDFEKWNTSVEGNTLIIKGNLTTEGTRRIMSVLELPPVLTQAMELANSPGSDAEGTKVLLATQNYYNSVKSLVEDLRVKPKKDHVKTFGQAAMWYDRYARKIDNLPILNVDDEMLNYGSNIAELFRVAEMDMKGVGMRASNRRAQNNPSSGGFYFTGGGYRAGQGYHGALYGSAGYSVSMNPMQASLQAKGRTDAIITRQERTKGAASVQQIWQVIDQETVGIRRKMTEKYDTEF